MSTQQISTNEIEILGESFDNWTGDEMLECEDLVYKLSLSNMTELNILFKVTLAENGEEANLSWPINGIKGSLAAGENATVALLHKIRPAESSANGKFEIEKLRVKLTWKPDASKSVPERKDA